MITQDQLKEVLRYDPETGRCFWLKRLGPRAMPGNEVGWGSSHGYIKIKILGITYSRSHVAWLYVYGHHPKECMDHINRVRNDDRISNLREATKGENCRNTNIRSDNSTGVKGVSLNNGKYMARINLRGKSIYLGTYDLIEDADLAYRKGCSKYHGEFASH